MKILIIIIIAFIFNCYKEKKDRNQNLEKKNEPILQKYEEIEKKQVYDSFIVRANGGLNMRSEPNIRASLLLTIPENAVVFKIAETDNSFDENNIYGKWVKIVYNYTFGYVFSGYLVPNFDNKKIIEYFFSGEAGLNFSYNYEEKRDDKTELRSYSYSFTFPPTLDSKYSFYPFNYNLKSPISLTVDSVKFFEYSDAGDGSPQEGYLHGPLGLSGQFQVNFKVIHNAQYIEFLKNHSKTVISGLIFYPSPNSFKCIEKSFLKNEAFPEKIDFLEYAIDFNNDDLPDLLHYRVAQGNQETEITFIKNRDNEWNLYRKNIIYMQNRRLDEIYAVKYLCY